MVENVDRCRLILVATPETATITKVESALCGADISSCILYQGKSSNPEFQKYCQDVVPMMQNHGAAVLVCDDTQIAGRSRADGIYLQSERGRTRELVAEFSPDMIVGCGGFKEKHTALEAAEAKPDFVFWGKLGGDIRDDTHPKNLALATWWSEFIEIPCVVLAGQSLESVVEASKSGADFVAIDSYVFDSDIEPELAVRQAEEQLELHAPRFEEVEE